MGLLTSAFSKGLSERKKQKNDSSLVLRDSLKLRVETETIIKNNNYLKSINNK